MANLAYCSTVASPLKNAYEMISGLDGDARMFLFSDDIKIWIDPVHVAAAYAAVEDALSRLDLSLSRSKTKIWTPSETIILPLLFKNAELQFWNVLERAW